MSYRGTQPQRMEDRAQDIFQYAGYTALWRHWVSATSGIPPVGGTIDHYASRTVTALFADFNQPEVQTPAGMIAAAMVQVTTNEKLTRNDLLVWRGIEYQVDSDPIPSKLGDNWIALIKRRDV